MKFLKLVPILFILYGNLPLKNLVYAEVKNPKDYKVLSYDGKKLSILNVEYFIKEGDEFIKKGDLDKAKDYYLDGRKLAKQLAKFYAEIHLSKVLMQEYQMKCKEKVRKHCKYWQNQMKG